MHDEQIYPPLTIVVKSVTSLPNRDEVVLAVSKLLEDSKSSYPRNHRASNFNVFIDSPPVGKGLFRQYFILCPRSDDENLRVAARARNASRQLLSKRAAANPGIFWLGLARHQNAAFLRALITRKFDRGEYSGISRVCLLQSGTHLEPPRRSVIDYITQIVNVRSRSPLPANVGMKPLDLIGDLMALHGFEPGIPTYRVGAVETRVSPGMSPLCLPDIRSIDHQSLE